MTDRFNRDVVVGDFITYAVRNSSAKQSIARVTGIESWEQQEWHPIKKLVTYYAFKVNVLQHNVVYRSYIEQYPQYYAKVIEILKQFTLPQNWERLEYFTSFKTKVGSSNIIAAGRFIAQFSNDVFATTYTNYISMDSEKRRTMKRSDLEVLQNFWKE